MLGSLATILGWPRPDSRHSSSVWRRSNAQAIHIEAIGQVATPDKWRPPLDLRRLAWAQVCCRRHIVTPAAFVSTSCRFNSQSNWCFCIGASH